MKKPAGGRVFSYQQAWAYLILPSLYGDMLAHDRIIFGHFHLVRRGLLVLVGSIEVTGAGSGDQADFIAFR